MHIIFTIRWRAFDPWYLPFKSQIILQLVRKKKFVNCWRCDLISRPQGLDEVMSNLSLHHQESLLFILLQKSQGRAWECWKGKKESYNADYSETWKKSYLDLFGPDLTDLLEFNCWQRRKILPLVSNESLRGHPIKLERYREGQCLDHFIPVEQWKNLGCSKGRCDSALGLYGVGSSFSRACSENQRCGPKWKFFKNKIW